MEPHSSKTCELFDIGGSVVPVDQLPELLDQQAVLINPCDSYVGSYIGRYLSSKSVGLSTKVMGEDTSGDGEEEEEGEQTSGHISMKHWRILGTLNDKSGPVLQWLWAVMKTEDYDAYLREILKCKVIIYDLTKDCNQERLDEIRTICDTLRSKVNEFKIPRVLILISTVHSWMYTDKSSQESASSSFTESSYRWRRTKPLYRELQLVERYVVASGKMTGGKLKAYVIGAGAVYGDQQLPFHHWFKAAWHNASFLPIYGKGKNLIPSIYIDDLARIVSYLMEMTPKKQRYILAVDEVTCQQDEIVKSISDELGTGRVKRVAVDDIYLNGNINTFQADQLLLNLNLSPQFSSRKIKFNFTGRKGMVAIMPRIINEYKKSRDLDPLKIMILGPPGIGKSTFARQLSDIYKLNHYTKEEMVTSTLEVLRQVAADEPELDIKGLDVDLEEQKRQEATKLLAEVDKSISDEEAIDDSVIIKLARYTLLSNQCQNQGFILDGFPRTYEQGESLFRCTDDNFLYIDEEGDDENKDPLDKRMIPDKVFVLEATDEFLKERLSSLPPAELQERHKEEQFANFLEEYRERTKVYQDTFLYYMDKQEILYFHINVATDESPMAINTLRKMTDMIGKPRNYGLISKEQDEIKKSQVEEKEILEKSSKEDAIMMENRELEERRQNIFDWMEKLAKMKKDEFEKEEAALMPLRQYLMSNVVPTLTKGLLDVTKARPEDPIEYLAEYLFHNNPAVSYSRQDTT